VPNFSSDERSPGQILVFDEMVICYQLPFDIDQSMSRNGEIWLEMKGFRSFTH